MNSLALCGNLEGLEWGSRLGQVYTCHGTEVWSSVHWVLLPSRMASLAQLTPLVYPLQETATPQGSPTAPPGTKTCLSHVIILICLLGDGKGLRRTRSAETAVPEHPPPAPENAMQHGPTCEHLLLLR